MLSRDEMESVVREIELPEPRCGRYHLLHIIGWSGDLRYRRIAERYLDDASDPMLAGLALKILCGFWNDLPTYLDLVRRSIAGVPWDMEDDLRLAAISVAGRYLRHHASPDLLGDLVRACNIGDENYVIAEALYTALAVAMENGSAGRATEGPECRHRRAGGGETSRGETTLEALTGECHISQPAIACRRG
jgi:hypothetical protein